MGRVKAIFIKVPVFMVILAVTLFLPVIGLSGAEAAVQVASYKSPDGFQVVSYSSAWADTVKLKGVYDELLRNAHGEELKLLNRINIYSGPDPQGMSAAGRWYGVWKMEDNKPRLAPNRYIDIYNGEELTTVAAISRILAHEYGHHFTYYYFFKKENKLWDSWKSTGFAAASGLKYNPGVSAGTSDHKWMVQEIAAEQYVQFFGSSTAKQSYHFRDISERLEEGQTTLKYNSDMYNYHPQENYEIPLAANMKGLKEYWLKASGLTDTAGGAPSQVSLRLEAVNKLSGVRTPQYVFAWTRSTDDRTARLEYTLVCFNRGYGANEEFYPVKTVIDGEPLEAVVGAAASSNMYIWEEVPTGTSYFAVYIKDEDGNITSSQVLAVDFTNPLHPDTALIDDASLASGSWFPPRVSVNSRQMVFDVQPVILYGRTLVPLRAIFEELGAAVNWNQQTQTITAIKGDTVLVLRVGSNDAIVNGKHISLDVPAMVKNGRTLVPLRFVSEALGAGVRWNQNLQLAVITQQ